MVAGLPVSMAAGGGAVMGLLVTQESSVLRYHHCY